VPLRHKRHTPLQSLIMSLTFGKGFHHSNEGPPAKTYPVSWKENLNQDRSTYTSGEQEPLIELSSFNMCSTLQTSQVI
jgi:hypothetical protein